MRPPILARQVGTGRSWDCLTLPRVPKPIMIAAVRPATGHDYLQAHLQMNCTDTDQCPLCNTTRMVRLRLKCDGTRAETRFCLSAKRTSPFKSAGASVQSTTGSGGVRVSGSNGSNAGYAMFRGSVKSTGYPVHSPVSPSLPLLCITVCHHISTGLYKAALMHTRVYKT
jgi:hypothetical protein